MKRPAPGARTLLCAAWALVSCVAVPAPARPEAATTTQRAELAPGVVLVLTAAPFDPARHDVSRCGDAQKACLIDGARAFGTLGELPRTEVVSLVLELDGEPVELESRAMYNPSSPREDRAIHAWLSRELDGRLTVRAEFADGAGAYRVEWEVTPAGSLRTILKCLECLELSLRSFSAPESNP